MHRRLDIVLAIFLLCGLMIGSTGIATGQEREPAELTLRIRRNFGYSLGAQMQGTFTLSVSGPDDLARVEFLLDGDAIGEDSEPPFNLGFNTRKHAEGVHRLSAIGYRDNGTELRSEKITRQFVATSTVTLVVLAVVVLVVTFRVGSHLLARRSSKGAAFNSSYGYLGGAVCPNCGRPFGLHWWSLRLGFGRLDRCPHCEKWNVMHRASADSLAEAENLFRGEDGTGDGYSQAERGEERFRRRIEDSRFDQS